MNTCEECRDALPAFLLGDATEQEAQSVRGHLATCPDCTAEAAELSRVLTGLLHAAPEVAPPPALRARLLASAAASEAPKPLSLPAAPASRASSAGRGWAALGLGLAAALGAGLLALNLWPASPVLRRADVVVAAGSQVVIATSNASRDSLTIRRSDGHLERVSLAQARPAWYTGGVFEGGRAYLLDAANERVVVLNMGRGRVEGTMPAPGGAAGLAVLGGRVFVKTAASGELLTFGGGTLNAVSHTSLAAPTQLAQHDLMDGVLALNGQLYTTQHTTGQVFVLSDDGQKLLHTYAVGGAPVALEAWKGRLLVLDVKGRLLELNGSGRIVREVKVVGTPDKLSVQGGSAYLTDRSGAVTVVDLARFTVTQRKMFGTPMDIVALPGGHLALADAVQGLLMLMPDLSPVPETLSLKASPLDVSAFRNQSAPLCAAEGGQGGDQESVFGVPPLSWS
ncbi:zf-HC2 domain-containing protein (plasmid) [Deinococcus sp. KNUC1210]|uniref:zf-HC2 domain-containing protein n=1 Tax=Deinococcus sp. KNUC1210 TaxID=2917691 RepID=UPI001EF10857|nr:zf-HC2 domain-containing protein [Deinococcus sp. KNUC1210]ULH14112.1 zf-HC2 domain-containing protein [Deinococcus sp. KNUC1210]